MPSSFRYGQHSSPQSVALIANEQDRFWLALSQLGTVSFAAVQMLTGAPPAALTQFVQAALSR